MFRQDVPSAHEQRKAHLVVDERQQAAAQQATLNVLAPEVEQRAALLRRPLRRQPCQLALQTPSVWVSNTRHDAGSSRTHDEEQ